MGSVLGYPYFCETTKSVLSRTTAHMPRYAFSHSLGSHLAQALRPMPKNLFPQTFAGREVMLRLNRWQKSLSKWIRMWLDVLFLSLLIEGARGWWLRLGKADRFEIRIHRPFLQPEDPIRKPKLKSRAQLQV